MNETNKIILIFASYAKIVLWGDIKFLSGAYNCRFFAVRCLKVDGSGLPVSIQNVSVDSELFNALLLSRRCCIYFTFLIRSCSVCLSKFAYISHFRGSYFLLKHNCIYFTFSVNLFSACVSPFILWLIPS